MTTITIPEAARRLGVTRAIAGKLRARAGVGRRVNSRLWLLTEADFRRLAAAAKPVGRPKKTA